MRRRAGNRRGQQIVEYLIIVAAIVAAVIVASRVFGTNLKTLLDKSNTKIQQGADAFGTQQPERVPGGSGS